MAVLKSLSAWQNSQEVILSPGRCKAATSHTASPLIKKTICWAPTGYQARPGGSFPRHPEKCLGLGVVNNRAPKLRPQSSYWLRCLSGWFRLVKTGKSDSTRWELLGLKPWDPQRATLGGRTRDLFKGFHQRHNLA